MSDLNGEPLKRRFLFNKGAVDI